MLNFYQYGYIQPQYLLASYVDGGRGHKPTVAWAGPELQQGKGSC